MNRLWGGAFGAAVGAVVGYGVYRYTFSTHETCYKAVCPSVPGIVGTPCLAPPAQIAECKKGLWPVFGNDGLGATGDLILFGLMGAGAGYLLGK